MRCQKATRPIWIIIGLVLIVLSPIIGQTRGKGIGYPFDGKSRGYGRLQGTAVMRKIQKERGGPH